MASTMLIQGLVVAYVVVAAVSAGEGNWARCLYWMSAAGITIAVLHSSTRPLTLTGLRWRVTYGSDALTIGCQTHRYAEWAAYTDVEIAAMHLDALPWWHQWKARLLAMGPDVKEPC